MKVENGKLKMGDANMANIIEEKSFAFAVRIVNLHKHLNETKKEFVLSKNF